MRDIPLDQERRDALDQACVKNISVETTDRLTLKMTSRTIDLRKHNGISESAELCWRGKLPNYFCQSYGLAVVSD